jgi:hypothetical protein
MTFSLFGSWATRPTTPVRRPSFRPRLEGFEDRVVPAQVLPIPSGLSQALVATAHPAVAAPSSILPINVTGVALDAATGALNVVGTIGNHVFSTTGILSLDALQTPTGTTPILHLQLNPIHLNLLGLTVDTSKICLDITAQAGPGNLLGNLLSSAANLLNGPNPPPLSGLLGTLLSGLSATQLTSLTGELADIINGALGQATSPSSVTSASGNILHLSLGPVNLNLLGLNVSLDNCEDGPVTVDIGAQAGPGRLLGNLLHSLTHLLDGPANANALNNALTRVSNEISHLVNL